MKAVNLISRFIFFSTVIILTTAIVYPSAPEDIEKKKFQVAVSAFSDGFYDVSLSLFELFIEEFPESSLLAEAEFYLAKCYYQRKDYEAAANILKELEAKAKISNLDEVYYWLGLAYLSLDQLQAAKINIDKIENKQLRLFRQGFYYFKISDYLQALETFNIFIGNYPQSEFLPEVYLNKADVLYALGRLNDAVLTYQYILDSFSLPDHSDLVNKAHYGLAWCYLKNGRFKEAINEFKNILEYTDNSLVKISSQIQIADLYQETGRYAGALDGYNEILKTQPDTIYADYIQFQMGMTFLKKKDIEEAIFALNSLRHNFPASKLIPQSQFYLAVGYFSQGDYAQAKSLLEDFIDKFSQSELIAKVYYLQGKCFFNQKEYQKALDLFQQIIGKFKDRDIEELAYIDIGNAYFNLGSFDKAKETWRDFLKTYPSSLQRSSVILHLGGLYENENNYTEAEKYYTKAFRDYKESSNSQEALFSLGHLYWSKGDLAKAQSYFEELTQKDTPLALKGKLYLAKVFVQNGQNKEALELYNQLINSQSSISKAALLDKAFLLKDIKDYHQAITAFKKVLSEDVVVPEAIFSLGLCLEKTAKPKEALKEYFKIIYPPSGNDNNNSDSSEDYKIKAYFRIAKIYEKINNLEAAMKIYQKVVDAGVEEAKIASERLNELKEK